MRRSTRRSGGGCTRRKEHREEQRELHPSDTLHAHHLGVPSFAHEDRRSKASTLLAGEGL